MNDDPQACVTAPRRWPVQLAVEPATRLPDITRPVVVAVVLWSVLILSISGVGYVTGTEIIVCHLRRWTGWPCPMCGGTRMVLSLLSGRTTDAFWFNPGLFVTLMAAILWLGVRTLTGYRVRMHTTSLGCWMLCCLGFAAILANWLYLLSK